MKVFCIAGKAGSGKDTAAKHLQDIMTERGMTSKVAHFGDLVKFVSAMYAGWDGNKDIIGRGILQYVGTDLFRARDKNYWVDFICDMLDVFNEWDAVLIPDTRFPNEIGRMMERGFDVVSLTIDRNEYFSMLTDEQQRHESETALEGYYTDYVVDNSGDEDELRENLIMMMNDIYGEPEWHQLTFVDLGVGEWVGSEN